ncbi:MAG: hypothetical protein XD95_0724 [Microgenomates bacterium 39_7]|nr:MAG: hypothetical protein XD95_0724 [Microgenomates bacterium 39_7]
MKKFVLPLSAVLMATVFGLLFRHSLFSAQGVLEINSDPPVLIFINGQKTGLTPFKKEFKPQKLTIKLTPEEDPEKVLWQGKVPITSSAITLIKYQFGQERQEDYGEILTLNKIPDRKNGALLVSSYPDKAIVNLDGETKGYTPLLLEEVSPGHHSLEINLDGYNNSIIGLNIAAGFQLNAEIKLAKITTNQDQEETIPEEQVLTEKTVTILSTPTGWLRVRSGPGTGFAEIAKVFPGEKYPFLAEDEGWLKISLEDETEEKQTEGWISSQYGEIED